MLSNGGSASMGCMLETVQILAPILLVDILNPVLLALLIFAASTGKPVANSAAMLLGHTLTYFFKYWLQGYTDKCADSCKQIGISDGWFKGLRIVKNTSILYNFSYSERNFVAQICS